MVNIMTSLSLEKNNLLFKYIICGPPFESLEEDNYLGQNINLELICQTKSCQ
jgi:hypothetical protein